MATCLAQTHLNEFTILGGETGQNNAPYQQHVCENSTNRSVGLTAHIAAAHDDSLQDVGMFSDGQRSVVRESRGVDITRNEY